MKPAGHFCALPFNGQARGILTRHFCSTIWTTVRAHVTVRIPPMQSTSSVPDATLGRLVVRNTIYLTLSQALTVPLAVLMNAMMARYLGPADFGFIYLAATLAGFGFPRRQLGTRRRVAGVGRARPFCIWRIARQ